jgi:predicted metal-binding protein
LVQTYVCSQVCENEFGEKSLMDEKIKKLALECGFTHVGALDPATITLREEVRAACAENKCGAFNRNWACPPACGSLEACAVKIHSFTAGALLQSTCVLTDPFDYETMQESGRKHRESLQVFAQKIKVLYPEALVLGAGPCTVCKQCPYPSSPCRFPAKMISSMEAQGIVVSDVCTTNNLPYYYGQNTLTYTGCLCHTLRETVHQSNLRETDLRKASLLG